MPEWDPIAPYYDDLFQDRTVDVQFWTALARDMGSPILELACGTGRLTFPIAQSGASIVGIDISKPMLARARAKLQHMPPTMKHRVVLLEKNACSFTIPGRKFAAIFSPWGFLPVNEEEEHGLFQSVKHHLFPNGRFIIDHENIPEPTGDWSNYRLKDYKHTRGGLMLTRHAYNSGQASTKLGTIVDLIDTVDLKGHMKRIIMKRRYKVYTKEEIVRLVYRNGFIVESLYGDYDKSPWRSGSSRTIVVVRPAGRKLADRLRTWIFS
jgi:ubiquinone/menaquinone biosynthesis C-methylase UbiE